MRAVSCVAFFVFFSLVPQTIASYWETWKIEGTILEVHETKSQNEQLTTRIKIRADKCSYIEGHGKNKVKEGNEMIVFLTHQAEEKLKPETKITIRYIYVEGLGQKGVVEGHSAELLEEE